MIGPGLRYSCNITLSNDKDKDGRCGASTARELFSPCDKHERKAAISQMNQRVIAQISKFSKCDLPW